MRAALRGRARRVAGRSRPRRGRGAGVAITSGQGVAPLGEGTALGVCGSLLVPWRSKTQELRFILFLKRFVLTG